MVEVLSFEDCGMNIFIEITEGMRKDMRIPLDCGDWNLASNTWSPYQACIGKYFPDFVLDYLRDKAEEEL